MKRARQKLICASRSRNTDQEPKASASPPATEAPTTLMGLVRAFAPKNRLDKSGDLGGNLNKGFGDFHSEVCGENHRGGQGCRHVIVTQRF